MHLSLFRPARSQGGFTLIELIVVIVILGILAATALPKMVDLGSDARKATLKAARGALTTTMAMAHGKSQITGSRTAPILMGGVSVAMVNGYPSSAKTTANAAGLSDDEWTLSVNGRDLHVSPKGAPTPTTCRVTYSEAVAENNGITPARVAINETGC